MKMQMPAKAKHHFQPKRHKVYFGGRGGIKSWSFAQALLIKGKQKKLRIICARELQTSIKDSVLSLLQDMIIMMGMEDDYTVMQNSIVGKNGTQFSFKGLKSNISSMKSFEGADICWCEEAEAITDESWNVLLPTIRKAGSEMWISFNPFDEMDSTYQRFVTPYIDRLDEDGFYEDPLYTIQQTSYLDNAWFSKELRDEMETCKARNYKQYQHIWLGMPNKDFDDTLIPPEWIEAAIDAHLTLKWDIAGNRVLGFDPADEGTDAKAWVSRHGSYVNGMKQWTTGDLEKSVERTYSAALTKEAHTIVYDGIGIGAGARIKFKQINRSLKTISFIGSNKVYRPYLKYGTDRYNKDMFRNLRSQYYWYLRDRFEKTYRAVIYGEDCPIDQMISLDSNLPDLKQLRSELSRIKRKRGHSSNGMIQMESKMDMKKRGMKSPNLSDALVYAFADDITNDGVSQKGFDGT